MDSRISMADLTLIKKEYSMSKFSLREFLGSEAHVLIDGREIEAARISVVFQDVEDEISTIKRLVKTGE